MRVEAIGPAPAPVRALQFEQLRLRQVAATVDAVTQRPATGEVQAVLARLESAQLDWARLQVSGGSRGPWLAGGNTAGSFLPAGNGPAASGARLIAHLLSLALAAWQSGDLAADGAEQETVLQVFLLALTYRGEEPLRHLGPYVEENPFRVESIAAGTLLNQVA